MGIERAQHVSAPSFEALEPRRLLAADSSLGNVDPLPLSLGPVADVSEPDAYEPDDTWEQATVLIPDIPQDHSIRPAGDEDWFTFTLLEDSSVVLTTLGDIGDTRMWLYDDALNEIAFDDDSGSGLFSQISTIISTGTYYVKANEYGSSNSIDSYTISVTATAAPATIAARHVFYNNSSLDGNYSGPSSSDDDAIDTNKQALLPGQTASAANYTSYSRGINGIMVDIDALPWYGLGLDDFEFRMGIGGDPSTWDLAPDPTAYIDVRPWEGVNGSDRVTIIWDDNAITTTWLQVTVRATANTGLDEDDVFYFANLPGDADGTGLVEMADFMTVKANLLQYDVGTEGGDFDLDGQVYMDDFIVLKQHFGVSVPLVASSCYIVGTVVDATTGDAIEGASVVASFDGRQKSSAPPTGSDGRYRLVVGTGATYTVSASAKWYSAEAIGDVQVGDDALVERHFALETILPRDTYEAAGDDVPGTATPITTDGAGQTHNTHLASDADWVTFDLAGFSTVTIETDGSAADTFLCLYGPDDPASQLVCDDNGSGSFSWIIRDGAEALAAGTYWVKVEEAGGDATMDSYTISVTATPAPAVIVGRHVFYNNSSLDGNDPGAGPGDDNAIDPGKQALLPGEMADSTNYTSYSRGINGIMTDIHGLAGTPGTGDFAFTAGDSGDPATWAAAPNPQSITVRPGAGVTGSDRVTIIWADSNLDDVVDVSEAVANRWLQVTVLSDANGGSLGLDENDVFYFADLAGDADGTGSVGLDDFVILKMHFTQTDAGISNGDFDVNGVVDLGDLVVLKQSFNVSLQAPAPTTGVHTSADLLTAEPDSAAAGAESPGRKPRWAKRVRPRPAAEPMGRRDGAGTDPVFDLLAAARRSRTMSGPSRHNQLRD